MRFLRGLGHHLDAVIMVGKEEIDENLLQSVEEVLTAHELIKIKLQKGCLLDRHEVAEELAEHSDAAIVQVLGNTILLYRPSKKKKIDLPSGGDPGRGSEGN